MKLHTAGLFGLFAATSICLATAADLPVVSTLPTPARPDGKEADMSKPKLPVMIATVGFNGDKMSGNTLVVHDVQIAVGDAKIHPEFAGTVKTVDTRPFWRTIEQSPGDEGHHYNRNAETYMLVGDALARGMIELLEKQPK